MIRTACIAATLLASTLLPIASASGAVTINGRVSQIVNALRYGSNFSQGNMSFSINTPEGPEVLFTGIAGVRAFRDYGALNDWVDDQPAQNMFDGGPYKFTHSVIGSYFDTPPKSSSLFDGSPYKFTHTVLNSYFGELQPSEDLRLIAGPIDPSYPAKVFDQPVPEPATWAMMISGFALVGAMLRRRSTVIRTA